MSSFSRPRLIVDGGTPRRRVGWFAGVDLAWLAWRLGWWCCLCCERTVGAGDRSFTTRFNADVPGNITMAANTLMVCPAAAAGCTAARGTSPIASGSNNAINNNNYNMVYVNTAPGAVAGSASFDSSSATLALPATATVLFAGLYWGADTSAGASVSGRSARPRPLRTRVCAARLGSRCLGRRATPRSWRRRLISLRVRLLGTTRSRM